MRFSGDFTDYMFIYGICQQRQYGERDQLIKVKELKRLFTLTFLSFNRYNTVSKLDLLPI